MYWKKNYNFKRNYQESNGRHDVIVSLNLNLAMICVNDALANCLLLSQHVSKWNIKSPHL